MKFKEFFYKPAFWNLRQREGLLYVILIIWIISLAKNLISPSALSPSPIFYVDSAASTRLHQLHRITDSLLRPRMYPFYPDYLTSYRAYVLGIDTAAYARIRQFRQTGKYFRSAEHFYQISGISDSLYKRLKPYIKIRKIYSKSNAYSRVQKKKTSPRFNSVSYPQTKADINTAGVDDLIKVYGIGKVLSRRIIKYRDKLGGFTIREQLKDVYGLSDEAYRNLWKFFAIKTPRPIKRKIDVNSANMVELQQNPYIDFDLAEKIVEYRSLHGKFKQMEDLLHIENFPQDKYNRIVLYLQIK